jgi:BirA family biotin operon repressor/biotin-[acetyl-CoA-carboxylase] ligase
MCAIYCYLLCISFLQHGIFYPSSPGIFRNDPRHKHAAMILPPAIHLETVDSTNVYARTLLAKSRPPEGTVIIADIQTDGIGQFNRKWVSAPGQNLTQTMILYPVHFPPQDTWMLTLMQALAVCATIDHQTSLRAEIRWPNDVMIGDRKCAGILCQASWMGERPEWVIAGIGLNLNQKEFGTDAPHATSLFLETGISFSPREISSALSHLMWSQYTSYLSDNKHMVLSSCNDRLWKKDTMCLMTATDSGTSFHAHVKEIDDEGRLVCAMEGGEGKRFRTGEARIIV